MHELTITSIYSAYEHSLLPTTPTTASTTSLTLTPNALPLDIILETLTATVVLIFAIVFSAPPLRPIRWNEWAGKIEREGWDPAAEARKDEGFVGKGGVSNPYRGLEERKGFWDVRGARRRFASFVRSDPAVA